MVLSVTEIRVLQLQEVPFPPPLPPPSDLKVLVLKEATEDSTHKVQVVLSVLLRLLPSELLLIPKVGVDQ